MDDSLSPSLHRGGLVVSGVCVYLDDSLSTSLHRGGLVASGVCVGGGGIVSLSCY